jgi:hypothetical protein
VKRRAPANSWYAVNVPAKQRIQPIDSANSEVDDRRLVGTNGQFSGHSAPRSQNYREVIIAALGNPEESQIRHDCQPLGGAVAMIPSKRCSRLKQPRREQGNPWRIKDNM